jgi:D-alanyl-D-alanine carboxypeptidase
VLQLVDEGRVALDAPVGAYLPGVVPNADRVTVRQLLDHSAGLPNYTGEPAFGGSLASDPGRVWTPPQLLAFVRGLPPAFAPGAGYAYSNTHYVVLGLLIERVTGRAVGDELQTRIFDRVGMPNTLYSTTTALPPPFAEGYYDFGFVRDTAVGTLLHPSAFGAAGAVVSTAADLARFAEALAAGTLLSAASAAAQRAVLEGSRVTSPGDGFTTGYGLGALVGGGWIGHDGAVPGYESEVYARTGGGGTIVVLLNKLTDRNAARALFRVVRDVQFPP